MARKKVQRVLVNFIVRGQQKALPVMYQENLFDACKEIEKMMDGMLPEPERVEIFSIAKGNYYEKIMVSSVVRNGVIHWNLVSGECQDIYVYDDFFEYLFHGDISELEDVDKGGK